MKSVTMRRAIALVSGILACSPAALMAAGGAHAPIVIANDSDFLVCSCVSGGSGTVADPYIIGPWTINSLPAGGAAVSVDGTHLTKSFTLLNLTIAGNGAPTSTGIVLNHINPAGQNSISALVTGSQTSIQSAGIGIVVENSNFVMLDGKGANPNGAGIGSGAVGTINKNFTGAIDIENSTSVIVRGWQFSANGQDNTPD